MLWASLQILVEGTRSDYAGYLVNVLWGIYTIMLLLGVVRAAVWQPPRTVEEVETA